jgi:hypothetical protein
MNTTLLRLLLPLALALPVPALAQADGADFEATSDAVEADEDIPLTPETLGDALSCRSHPAAVAFATALFLQGKPPPWMREIKDSKETEGVIGLYGFTLSKPVALLGEQVSTAYFLKDWVVTLWPRDKAAAFIAAQKMERAPIKVTEQYYRFVDPEAGPMLGAYEPTGGSIEAALAKAFGGEAPPSPPADQLFVGCNYTPASRADFLEAAAQSEAMLRDAAADIAEPLGSADPD